MKITQVIAQHILECYEGDNWSEVSFNNILPQISLKESVTVTEASSNTIAALVNHVIFYNEVVLERLKGNDPEIDDSNGFRITETNTEEEWKILKERCQRSFQNLAAAVENFSEEKLADLTLQGKNSFYKTLHGNVEHAYYHLGQVLILFKLLKAKEKNEIRSTW